MNQTRVVKLVFVLYLMMSITLLPIQNKQNQDEIIAASNPKELVFKLNDEGMTEESKEVNKLDELLVDNRLQGATTAISIRKASDGELIYSHQGDVRVRPASVMKLLTSVTALETLGQNHTFKTELYTDGEIKNGMVQGDIYIRGQGDPTLIEENLGALVVNLKSIGITGIDGNLYGDDTWYDDDRLSQDLNWSDEPYYTGAQVSALTLSPNDDYDAGTIIVEVYPATKAGEPGMIRTVPETDYVEIINKTKTTAKDSVKYITTERVHGSNTIIVVGTIPLGFKKARSWASIWEPTDYVVNLFEKKLEIEGVHIVPTSQVSRGKVPEGATLVALHESGPLEELLIPFLKLSNNGHGEVLVKEMGRVIEGEGSWDKGLSVMGNTLTNLGIDMDTMLLRDGSGMSHKTLVTADEITKLLHVVQTKSWYPTFLNALPVAGADERFTGGTLRYRMKGTVAEGNVQAKTGTLNGVTSLAGYVQTQSGEDLIFSIIINNHLDDTTEAIIDQMTVEIAGW